jgi:hypothetical protein
MIILKTRLFVFGIFFFLKGYGQSGDLPEYRTGQLESIAEKNNKEPDDDSYELELDQIRRHPLNLNIVTEEELLTLHILQPLQVRNFMAYRKLLGPLVSVREIQAIPGWDIETIHKMLPYITVRQDESMYSALEERWKGGDADFLFRISQVPEKSKGFEKPAQPGDSYYEGSPQKIFFRYGYHYTQLLSYGFTGDKDAGEPFFRGAQRYGFDFYSFHFFLRQVGIVSALAIGDFTVNMGQGLIQWQTTAFTKTSQAMAIKREGPFLKPYHSAGEFNFHRGVGINLEKEKWAGGIFASYQKISSNLEPDTAGREDLFSSFQNSGYHRTPAEIADRNNTSQFSAGGSIHYNNGKIMFGLNGIYFHFSRPFQKQQLPYNLYSLKGTRLADYSFDYSYTFRNMHLFGELALDQDYHSAFVQGALISLSDKLDMSFLYRNISPAFQSLYSDAFTENTVPNNEHGFYAGLAFRPAGDLTFNLYYDIYIFPWLKYQVDGPSQGRDIFIQALYQPNKSWHLITSYKNEMKSENAEVPNSATHELIVPEKKRWRIDTDYILSRSTGFITRMEFVWIDQAGIPSQHGFLGMAGLRVRRSGLSGNIALTMFETDNYDTRIYVYESGLPYNYSLPVYYGKGLHYSINLHADLKRLFPHAGKHTRLAVWLNWGQTFYPGLSSIGTGLDEISGNRKSEIKGQFMIQW